MEGREREGFIRLRAAGRWKEWLDFYLEGEGDGHRERGRMRLLISQDRQGENV